MVQHGADQLPQRCWGTWARPWSNVDHWVLAESLLKAEPAGLAGLVQAYESDWYTVEILGMCRRASRCCNGARPPHAIAIAILQMHSHRLISLLSMRVVSLHSLVQWCGQCPARLLTRTVTASRRSQEVARPLAEQASVHAPTNANPLVALMMSP